MKSLYDVVVVGAGPAGSMAALQTAKAGLETIILERKKELAVPVRCAEGVSQKGFHDYFEPDPRWIASVIEGVVLVAPNGESVNVEEGQGGYVLNRDIFDADLTKMAANAGVVVRTGSYVNGLLKEGSQVVGVRYIRNNKSREIRSKIVIGADGLESRVGRWADIETFFAMRDMESCAQATLSGITVDSRHITMFFGREVAPGGYAWIFPKGKSCANIGLGVSGRNAKNRAAHIFLKDFIGERFPFGKVVRRVAGGVPCGKTLKRMTTGGLMLVGDAAHQVNPLTGGGIVRAIQAGDIAGRVAAKAIRKGDVSSRGLKDYPKEWHEKRGKLHAYYYKLKEAVYTLTDERFNHIAEIMNKVPKSEITFYNIFKTALINRPGLLTDLVKSMTWSKN